MDDRIDALMKLIGSMIGFYLARSVYGLWITRAKKEKKA
jgi:hypothetical protein